MEERMKVIIEADVSRLQKGIADAQSRLQNAERYFRQASKAVFQLENAQARLGAQLKSGAISQQQFSKQIEIVNRDLQTQRANVSASAKEVQRLNSVIAGGQASRAAGANQQLANSFQNVTTNIRGSNSVAIEFNRIIQDAPFGIIGVGNNIQQLAGNFSNLRNQAGSTGKALSAAFTSIISPVNLALLAISAITAGWTAYQMNARKSKDANDDLKSSVDQLKEAQDKYNESLKDTNKLMVEANYQQFLKDIGALKKEWVDLGNGQGFFVDRVDDSINVLDGFEQKVRNMRLGELEMYKRFFETELVNAQRAIVNLDVTQNAGQIALLNDSVSNFRGALSQVNAELAKFENIQKQFDPSKGSSKVFKPIDPNQLFSTDYRQLQKDIEAGLSTISENISKQNAGFQAIKIPVDFTPETLDPTRQAESDAFDQQWKERQKTIERFGASMERTLAGTFERSIMQGDNFFEAVEQGFKRLLARMAAQLAASAVIRVIGMIVGGPAGGAIAAGAGGALSGMFRANGGPVTKGQPYIVGEKRPELFIPNTSGRIIPHVPNVAPDMSASYGGAGAMEVIVHGKIMNDHIAIAGERGRRSNNRYYGINGK